MSGRHRSSDPIDGGQDAASVEFAVLAGDPTAEELAAVTAVLTALAQEADLDVQLKRAAPRSAWRNTRAVLRQPLIPGPGAWRAHSG